jgi:heme oxygenase (biliverdin-IX-beta and delta-forming)
MSQHADPSTPAVATAAEPSYAERARTLVHVARAGALSTLSRRLPGHPFGSVMPYAPDALGRPLVLISGMAMHTRNLEADPRASLLVTQPGRTEDPLAAARATLMGEARRLAAPDLPGARAGYLERHPDAAAWVDFDDFAFWRLEVAEVYYVGGFAAMDWVGAEAYAAARPDPLAEGAASIIEHMNRDHGDALLVFARVLGGIAADAAEMVAVDRLGFRLRIRTGPELTARRIAFPAEVTSLGAARTTLIAMLADCRARAAG